VVEILFLPWLMGVPPLIVQWRGEMCKRPMGRLIRWLGLLR
jgi:hypothetical protein